MSLIVSHCGVYLTGWQFNGKVFFLQASATSEDPVLTQIRGMMRGTFGLQESEAVR